MKRNKILFIIGLSFLLILVLGASYAYFSINVVDNSTDSSIMGTTNKYGTVIMKTETDKLYFNFLGDEMEEYAAYIDATYYATNNPNGNMSETEKLYTLATIKNTDSDISVDCTYKFKITASVSKSITDGSDEDIYLGVDNKLYTLKKIVESGENGIIHTGSIFGIENNETKNVLFEAFIHNSSDLQQDLVKNKFSFKVEPYKENGKSAISCKPHYIFKKDETFANNLIKSGKLWQSGLEGDGYRYTFNEYNYENLGNIICFGVSSKEECLANPQYLMFVVGVFPDEHGDNHVKIVTSSSLTIDYDKSDLSKNWKDTSVFQTFQNILSKYPETLTNKIATWNWNTVNATEGLDFKGKSAKEIYNYEMNKTTSINVSANREIVSSKLGLLYVSDILLSYGNTDMTQKSLINLNFLEYGCTRASMSPIGSYLIMALCENCGSYFDAFLTKDTGGFFGDYILFPYPISSGNFSVLNVFRPSFYLNSDVKVLGGDGTINDPYIIN